MGIIPYQLYILCFITSCCMFCGLKLLKISFRFQIFFFDFASSCVLPIVVYQIEWWEQITVDWHLLFAQRENKRKKRETNKDNKKWENWVVWNLVDRVAQEENRNNVIVIVLDLYFVANKGCGNNKCQIKFIFFSGFWYTFGPNYKNVQFL